MLWRLFFPHLPVGRGWAPEYNPERPNCHHVERAYGGSRLTTDRMLPAKRLLMLPIVLLKLGVTIGSVLYRFGGILPPGRNARTLSLGLGRSQGARSPRRK